MTAEEILARAADLVEISWAQNIKYDGGPCCAGVALNKAAHGHIWSPREEDCRIDLDAPRSAADHAWLAFCREIGVMSIDNIPIWNDMPWRTAEEVATALRNSKRWL